MSKKDLVVVWVSQRSSLLLFRLGLGQQNLLAWPIAPVIASSAPAECARSGSLLAQWGSLVDSLHIHWCDILLPVAIWLYRCGPRVEEFFSLETESQQQRPTIAEHALLALTTSSFVTINVYARRDRVP